MSRRGLAALGALAVLAGTLATRDPAGAVAGQRAAAPPLSVVPIPAVHATTTTTRYRGIRRVLVTTLVVSGPGGLSRRVTCNRCLRFPGTVKRLTPASGTVVYSGVNWLLVPGHDIRVAISRPHAVGRFELLSASASGGLVFRTSGCLKSLTTVIRCPQGVGTLIPGSKVTKLPGTQTKTPATAPTTAIVSGPAGTVTALPIDFTYSSNVAAASFECNLDGTGWVGCPAGGISYQTMTAAVHTFQVRALAGDLIDTSPPERSWTQAAATTCPTGQTGTPPNCATPTCPTGQTGTPPSCATPTCPTGQTGTPPNCATPTCPTGQTGTPPNCATPTCPTGQTGTPPNCATPTCPTGQTGTPPSCATPTCPTGQTGTPPNCVTPPVAVTDYNCPGTPNGFGHYVPAGKHWGNDFIAQGSVITGGTLVIGANTDGGNHQARIGIFTGGPNTLSGELGETTVSVNGYGGVSFTFSPAIHVSTGESLWLEAIGVGDFTAYDQNNGGVDGCFSGTLVGTA